MSGCGLVSGGTLEAFAGSLFSPSCFTRRAPDAMTTTSEHRDDCPCQKDALSFQRHNSWPIHYRLAVSNGSEWRQTVASTSLRDGQLLAMLAAVRSSERQKYDVIDVGLSAV